MDKILEIINFLLILFFLVFVTPPVFFAGNAICMSGVVAVATNIFVTRTLFVVAVNGDAVVGVHLRSIYNNHFN